MTPLEIAREVLEELDEGRPDDRIKVLAEHVVRLYGFADGALVTTLERAVEWHVLKAQVAELIVQLERVTSERDALRVHLERGLQADLERARKAR